MPLSMLPDFLALVGKLPRSFPQKDDADDWFITEAV